MGDRAVHIHAADADVLERTESGVVRRCGFIPMPDLFAEFDPHAFDEFQRLGVGEDACLHIALVVGIEVLVHAARRIAARVAFDEQAHEDEVVELHGFTEGLRRVFGDSVAGLGHPQQFGLAGAVLFDGGQLAGGLRVAAAEYGKTVTGDGDGFPEVAPVVIFHIVEIDGFEQGLRLAHGCPRSPWRRCFP